MNPQGAQAAWSGGLLPNGLRTPPTGIAAYGGRPALKHYCMELELKRKYMADGTNGVISLKGVPLCKSIELPWKKNMRKMSCIPEGRYLLRLRHSARYGKHLELIDVPGRSLILLHCFNHALKESQGCIAPVEQTAGPGRGYGSRAALDKLLRLATETSGSMYLTIKKGES